MIKAENLDNVVDLASEFGFYGGMAALSIAGASIGGPMGYLVAAGATAAGIAAARGPKKAL